MPDRTTIGRSIIAAATLVVAVLLVLGQTLTHDFTAWDDDFNIPGNRNLNPVSWQGVANHWREPYAALYVPMTYTFWAAESWLSSGLAPAAAPNQLQPWVFHAGNLLLHSINVLLVWSILRRLGLGDLPAWCGAMLYALHPLQVESVAWITETKGLLSATFGWLAIRLHLSAHDAESPAARRLFLRQAVATVAFGLALLAKPSAVVFPLMALLIDVAIANRNWRQSLTSLAPWFVLSILGMIFTAWIQSGDEVSVVPPPRWQRPFVAGDAIAFYLFKLVLPWNLAISYSRTPAVVLESGIAYVAWLLPVAVAALLATLRERRILLAAFAIFVVGMLPVLGLVPFAYQINSTVADRYAYLSMFGPALAVAWILSQLSSRLCYAAYGVIVLGCGLLSAWQATYWRTDVDLFLHTVDVNPRTYVVRGMLAQQLMQTDPPDLEGAIYHFRESIPISHEPAKPYAALGMLFYSQKDYDQALIEFDRSLEFDPQLAAAHNGRGATLLARGRVTDAIAAFRRSTEVDPSYSAGWFNLARVIYDTGDKKAAIELMQRGLTTIDDPHAPEHAELQSWLAE